MQSRPIRVNVLGHGIVEFPAGTSDAEMEQALKQLSVPAPSPAAPAPSTPWLQQFSNRDMVEHGTRHADTVSTDAAVTRARNAAPLVGGAIAAGATMGASIPVQLAATGAGAAAGQALKDAPEDLSPSDRFSNMAFEGLKNILYQGTGMGMAGMAPRLAQGARDLWKGAAKITEPVAKSTQTMRRGGTFDDAKDEIADTVLSMGTGTIRKSNLERMRESINALDDAIDSIVQNSTGMVSRQELRDALQRQYAAVPAGSQAGQAERAALERTFAQLKNLPPKMTVAKAQEMKRYIYRAYEKTFAADATQAAAAQADKTVARQLRTSIAREEPLVEGLNAQMSRQIPATKAMEKAVSRTSNHNAVGLTSTMAGMVTNPLTMGAALLNHPKIASFTAQQIYTIAQKLPVSQQTPANIFRLAEQMVSDLFKRPTEGGR